jgi:NAD(P)-dependent dehydrogenase (short-subunit alcohol dehydrogenase family)
MTALFLKNKLTIVTGAASGIGAAVAKHFAACGAEVALVDINLEGAKKTCSELVGGDRHKAFYCDLGDPSQCESVAQQVFEWRGRIDVLINAAAYLDRRPVDDVDIDYCNRNIAINMTGPFFLARACAKPMLRQGSGRIILFSSQGAFTGGFNGSAVYAMTKAGVLALVKSLAREYAEHGVTVNSIAPGGVDTPMLRGGMSEADVEGFIERVPMGRLATPAEIAAACEFLASDKASYITGTTLDVNGGQLMR